MELKKKLKKENEAINPKLLEELRALSKRISKGAIRVGKNYGLDIKATVQFQILEVDNG